MQVTMDSSKLEPHLHAQLGVETRQRLVEREEIPAAGALS